MKPGEFIMALIIMAAICGFCFEYTIYSCIGLNVPWYADCIAGTLAAPLTIPAFVICWVLRLCGLEVPFFEVG
jgi:hypothetical protein